MALERLLEMNTRTGGSLEASRKVIREALAAVRAHLGMEVAFVGRFSDGRRYFEYVDSDARFVPISPGESDELEASFCARVVDGRIPQLIPDAAQEPGVSELPATSAMPVGAHLSVPMQAPSGEPFGTVCCFSRQADPELRERDLVLLRLVAGVIEGHMYYLVDREREQRRAHRAVRLVLEVGGPAVALQPIVDLAADTVCGFEALSRFDLGPAWSPERWFDEAESVGLGPELEAAAVRAALALLPDVPADKSLSVNVSASALCATDEILQAVAAVDSSRVVVELTEHQWVEPSETLNDRLAALRTLGARIAVDDAGSGYAGLQHIVHLRPEVLKLDRVLVQSVAWHSGRQAMIEAMVAFTRRTGAQLIAEGVEVEADLEALRELGVTHAQGFLLGRPTRWA